MRDVLQYEGKRVVVTGAASGMGQSCVAVLSELGADVHGLDVTPADAADAEFHRCDLSDAAQIERAVSAIGGPIDSLFNCAGLPTTAPGHSIMRVNFIGHRQLTEACLQHMADGASIGFISSVAGMGWQGNLELLLELLATPDAASAAAWCEAHDDVIGANGYGFSKEAINAYVARRDASWRPRGSG